MSRQDSKLQDGLAQPVRHEARGFNGGPIDLTSMALVCQGGGQDSWLLTIYADTGVGMSMLGRIRTLPWDSGRRTLAICAMPGARAWEVAGKRIVPVPAWGAVPGDPVALSGNDRLGLWMTSTRQVGGPWGITPIRGFAEIAKTPKAISGVSGAFTVRGNVTGWTAFNANVLDGSVVVNAQAPRIVPGSGGIIQGGPVPYLGYANFFDFAGTTAYTVEYETEDPFEGAGA